MSLLQWKQWQLFFNGAVHMTRGSTRPGNENNAKAALFHWGWRRSMGAAILNCVLENDVSLFVHAVKCAQEKPSIFDTHQHFAMQQFSNLGYRIWSIFQAPIQTSTLIQGVLSCFLFHAPIQPSSGLNYISIRYKLSCSSLKLRNTVVLQLLTLENTFNI